MRLNNMTTEMHVPCLAMLDNFPWLSQYRDMFIGLSIGQWLGIVLAAIVALAAGVALQWAIVALGRAFSRRTGNDWDDEIVEALPGPLKYFLGILLFEQFVSVLGLPADVYGAIAAVAGIGLIFTIAWFLLRTLKHIARFAEGYFSRGIENTPQARAIHTQVSVVRTILRLIIMIGAVAIALMQFEVARTLGMSLLTTAGVATFAIGFAAQRTIASLFAGVQVAFTQTIKIGDVVVVEGEWGRIEDIKLTYVVVKIWDLRRLIVPVTYFTEKPIENWTTTGTEVLGTIYMHTDYGISLDDVRAELDKILEESDLWDGKTKGVICTNLTETGAEVRILISAADSGKQWDLRCLVRERMLKWLQTRGEDLMPTYRVRQKPTHDKDPTISAANVNPGALSKRKKK